MARAESRFGFGHLIGAAGAIAVGASVGMPWLRLDLPAAFQAALSPERELGTSVAGRIMYVASTVPSEQAGASPRVAELAARLGVAETGLAQDRYLAIAVIAAAVIALVGTVRSVRADSAWQARRPAPLLTLGGIAGLVAAGIELFVLAPAPREAMRPDLGLWVLVAGSGALLLGALTLGRNRRGTWLEDADARDVRYFENTEHLAYSHGAWVPRSSADRER